MVGPNRESLFAKRLLLKGLLFAFIMVLCCVGFGCSAARESQLPSYYRDKHIRDRYPAYYDTIKKFDTQLAVVTLVMASLSFLLALGPLALASITIWRHLRGNRQDGGLVLVYV